MISMQFSSLLAGLLSLIILLVPAQACESCALYKASKLQGPQGGSLTLSVSTQYTEYSRTEAAPENSIRDGDFDQSYSTTDFALGYDLSDRFGLYASLPLIRRSFEQVTNYRSDEQSDVGIGDAVLVGNYSVLRYQKGSWWMLLSAVGGVKFPTGDTGSLDRFAEAEDTQTAQKFGPIHHSIGTGQGGQTLVMGNGSLS